MLRKEDSLYQESPQILKRKSLNILKEMSPFLRGLDFVVHENNEDKYCNVSKNIEVQLSNHS